MRESRVDPGQRATMLVIKASGLDVDGVKLLSVNKCHGILFVWTYDPDVGTIDGPDHIWKVRNIIKRSFGISQVLWE